MIRLLVATALCLVGCTANPFVVQPVTARLYRFPQPTTDAQWQQVAQSLGRGGIVVKLNDDAEGSDSGSAQFGLVDEGFAIEPKGDGPIYAQVRGVFTQPDETTVTQALAFVCDPAIRVGVHCTHGFDRTGYVIARARVQCDGWAPDRAHDEWHRLAHYVPYGDRIPAPGLEAAWASFVQAYTSPDRATSSVTTAEDVIRAVESR